MTLTRRSSAAIVALVVAAAPVLAGCWNGQQSSASVQSTMNTGNGTQVQVGSIRVENATVVKSLDSSEAALTMTLVNVGSEDDVLVAVEVGGVPATVSPASTVLPRGGITGVSFGWNSDNTISFTTDAEISTYVDVLLQFRVAGVTEFTSLVVPRAGYYADVS